MRIAVAPLLVAGVLSGISPALASASACAAWTGVQPPDPGGTAEGNTLAGVAALSSCDAWAVGYFFNGTSLRTLTVHWNGTAWTQAASPDPASGGNVLGGVAATSGRNAWAAGYYFSGTANQTLIEHWDGTAWTQVASPDPAGPSHDNLLTGIAATSASNAWAVGFTNDGTVVRTLIEHWNGTAWQQVTSPSPSASNNTLAAVTAISADNAWAVGSYISGGAGLTLIEHWNGHTWKRVPSPNPGGPSAINTLSGAAAISVGDAWAVGFYASGAGDHALVEHWNGHAWKHVAIPDLGGPTVDNQLRAISASSAANAWAVGSYSDGTANQTLALHCC